MRPRRWLNHMVYDCTEFKYQHLLAPQVVGNNPWTLSWEQPWALNWEQSMSTKLEVTHDTRCHSQNKMNENEKIRKYIKKRVQEKEKNYFDLFCHIILFKVYLKSCSMEKGKNNITWAPTMYHIFNDLSWWNR